MILSLTIHPLFINNTNDFTIFALNILHPLKKKYQHLHFNHSLLPTGIKNSLKANRIFEYIYILRFNAFSMFIKFCLNFFVRLFFRLF